MVTNSRLGYASVHALNGIALLAWFLPQYTHAAPLARLSDSDPSTSMVQGHRLQPRVNVSIGLSFDSPSIKTSLEAMLLLIDSDAVNRFVTVNQPTSFGSDDAVESNNDLSELVDVVFSSPSSSSETTVQPGWVDTYLDFLVEVGEQSLPDLEEQDSIINQYYDAVKEVATEQAKLVQAYNDANGGASSVTNIGVNLPETDDVLEPLTVSTIEQWASGKFGLSTRKVSSASGGNNSNPEDEDSENSGEDEDTGDTGDENSGDGSSDTGNSTSDADSGDSENDNSSGDSNEDSNESDSDSDSSSQYTQEDYNNYLKAKQTLAAVTPEYLEIKEDNVIAGQGYLYQQLIPTYPGVQNLSMIVGGTPNSRQAKFAAAWSATIINTTSISSSDASEVQGNLNNSSMNSTVGDTPTASSINFERPESSTTSLASATASGNASASAFVSALNSGISAVMSKSAATASANSSSASASPTPKPSSSATSSKAAASASSTASKRAVNWSRSRFARRPIPAPAPPAERNTNAYLSRRSSSSSSPKTVSNALKLAAQSQSKQSSSSVSSTASSASDSDSAFAPSSPALGIIHSSKNRVQTGSTASAAIPPLSSNSSDPLSGIPDTPLQGTMELLSLQEGAWSNNRTDFMSYAKKAHPDIFGKYFGNSSTGGEGSGPLGRHWTHLVIITTYEGNSSVQTVTMLGKVYDTLPELKVVGQGTMGGKASSASSGTKTGSASATLPPISMSSSVAASKPTSAPVIASSSKGSPTAPASSSAEVSGTPAVRDPRVGVVTGTGGGAKLD